MALLSLLSALVLLTSSEGAKLPTPFKMMEEWTSRHDTYTPGQGETPVADEMDEADRPRCQFILKLLNSSHLSFNSKDADDLVELPDGLDVTRWDQVSAPQAQPTGDRDLEECARGGPKFSCKYYRSTFIEKDGGKDNLLVTVFHFNDGRSPIVGEIYSARESGFQNIHGFGTPFRLNKESYLGDWGEEDVDFSNPDRAKALKRPVKTFNVYELSRLAGYADAAPNKICVFSLSRASQTAGTTR